MYIQMYGCTNYGYDGMQNLCTASNAVSRFWCFLLYIVCPDRLLMIILNLFIGVIANGMDVARAEQIEEAQRQRGAS